MRRPHREITAPTHGSIQIRPDPQTPAARQDASHLFPAKNWSKPSSPLAIPTSGSTPRPSHISSHSALPPSCERALESQAVPAAQTTGGAPVEADLAVQHTEKLDELRVAAHQLGSAARGGSSGRARRRRLGTTHLSAPVRSVSKASNISWKSGSFWDMFACVHPVRG